MKDSKNSSTTSLDALDIRNILNLSIIEITSLQILLQYHNPIVRYSLFEEINNYFNQESKKADQFNKITNKSHEKIQLLSTSSFYNSLTNLEALNLISFNYDEKGKINSIEATPLASTAINLAYQNLMRIRAVDIMEIVKNASDYIEKKNPRKKPNNLALVVFPFHFLTYKILEYLSSQFEEVFLISKEETLKSFHNAGIVNINYSNVYNQQIFAPNDSFTEATIVSYSKNIDFFGMTRTEVLKETVRIVQSGGIVTVVVRSQFGPSKNFIVNEFVELFRESVNDLIFTEQELKKELVDAGLINLEIREYNGILLGIGQVK